MKTLRKYKTVYLMMLPIALFFFIFSYYPLLNGLVISLQDYRLIGPRPFVGLNNYIAVLQDPNFLQVSLNTFRIGGGMLAAGFIMPLLLALSLNEVMQRWFKKTAQLIVYIPHLFSWVVVGGMWILLLSPDTGLVNQIILTFGGDKPIHFLATESYAPWVIVFVNTWKEMGYTCIMYLAAIAGINPSLYEAARMDGATRRELIWHVTVPQLVPTMKVVLMLNALSVLRMFDPVLMMSNGANARAVDVIMMYTYQKGILEYKVSIATAAGFIVIAATFVLTYITRKLIKYDEG
ncbi:ABC transporter permease [Paenibacillus sp. 598K]|uniref:ABC transporter permease subunit n=1 Tax=Paenibacillus sp. 598K TaxID=1117987 RepID=UPI000FF9676E|nr:ABC transporter permease subunit [Paenibacillus sp. 598K]GBF74027.1 ABC transporter permease [Paenibacillus sp. 598K]